MSFNTKQKMKTKAYPKYKPSGIEWLGDVPEHWTVKIFRHITYMKGRIGWQGLKQSEFSINEDDPFLITGMNFKDGKINWNEVYHISEERYNEAPEIQLKIGDLLITKDGTIGKLLLIDEIPFPGKASLNSHLLVIRPLKNNFLCKYLFYQFSAKQFEAFIDIKKTGTTFYGLTQEAVGEYKILLPPLPEQQAIAAFLDRKTGIIDTLIARKQQLIEQLREQRTAMISRAVTKGLNPKVKMKPSGVEWLADIPEHWEVKKLKYCFTLKTKKAITDNNPVALENIESWTGRFIVTESEFEGEGIAFNTDDILFGKLRPYLAKVYLAEKTGESIGDIFVLNPKSQVIPRFGVECLRTKAYIEIIDGSAYGSKMPRANWELMGKLPFLLPPLPEQKVIAEYLDHETGKIDALASKVGTAIDKLKEYRTALISAAVTGKIDVATTKITKR